MDALEGCCPFRPHGSIERRLCAGGEDKMSTSKGAVSENNTSKRTVGGEGLSGDEGESSACSTLVAGIPGYGAFVFTSASKFDDSHSVTQEPPRKRGKTDVKSETDARLIRSYGTFRYLVLNTLNATLAEVEDAKRQDGADIVKVGATALKMLACLYIEVSKTDQMRTLCIVLDTNRRRKDVD